MSDDDGQIRIKLLPFLGLAFDLGAMYCDSVEAVLGVYKIVSSGLKMNDFL